MYTTFPLDLYKPMRETWQVAGTVAASQMKRRGTGAGR